MVERLVANEKVEGSSPFARSKITMDDLSKKCVACDGNIPPFDTKEIHKYLKKVDGWDVKSNDDKSFYLIKAFEFKNFNESQNFVNKVSDIAEEETSPRYLLWLGLLQSKNLYTCYQRSC